MCMCVIVSSELHLFVQETFFFLNSTLNPKWERERTEGDNAHHGLECDNCPLVLHFFLINFFSPNLVLTKYCLLQHYSKDEPIIKNGNSFPETKTISTENGTLVETQDKDVVSEDVGTVAVYDQWIAPSITGQPPKARYEVRLPFKISIALIPFFLLFILIFTAFLSFSE